MVAPKPAALTRIMAADAPAAKLFPYTNGKISGTIAATPKHSGKTKKAMEWATGRFRESHRVR